MQPTWQTLVDAVRGIGPTLDLDALASDPETKARIQMLRELAAARMEDVPEFAVLRAKAILPIQPRNEAGWRRFAVAFDLAPAFGFRNADLAQAALTVPLLTDHPDAGTLTLRRETIAQSDRIALIGQVETRDGRAMLARVDGGPEAWCDEFGQFTLEISDSTRRIEIVDVDHETIYDIDLP